MDASVYIAEFDTTIVATTVKIDKFKFEDAGLNKCYNLSDNTASFRGNTLNVMWNSHVYNSWRDEIDFSFELEGPMSGSKTETETSSGDYPVVIDNDVVWVSDEQTITISYTYKKQHVLCYRFNDYHYAMDSKFTAEGYGPFWLKQYDFYDATRHVSGTRTFSNDGHKESYSSTTSGEGRDFLEWPNDIVFDGGQGGYAVFEEGGKIIYLVYYVSSSNPQYNYYVKAVFDKASNTVND